MTLYQIKSHTDGRVLYECEAESLAAAVNRAVAAGSDLRYSNLSGSDLSYSNLRGLNLRGSNLSYSNLRGLNLSGSDLSYSNLIGSVLSGSVLSGSDLSGSNLRYSNLRGSDLSGSDLSGSDLRGSVLNWRSHALVGEILRRHAGKDPAKRKIAGLVLVSTDWCWQKFLAIDDPLRDWAISVLRDYVQDGDRAPDVLTASANEESGRDGQDGRAMERTESAS